MIVWNRAIEEMTGVCAADMIGKGSYEHALPFYQARRPMLADLVLHPDPAVEAGYLSFERQQNSLLAEGHLPRLGGGVFLWGRATPLYDAQGQVSGAIETLRDMSEVQRNQQELNRRLRESLLLKRVIEAATSTLDPGMVMQAICREMALAFQVPQAGIALLNSDQTALTVVAEYPTGEEPSAIGATIPLANNPATLFVLEKHEPLAIANSQTDERMAAVHELMKERRVVSMLLVPVLVHDRVLGTVGLDAHQYRGFTPEDIALAQNAARAAGQALENARLHRALQDELAERVRVQEALRENEERYRTLVENQGEGVVILDPQGNFTFCNSAAETIFGVPGGGLIRRNLDEFIEAWQLGYLKMRASTIPSREKSMIEIDIVRPDRERRNLIGAIGPQFDLSGKFIGQFAVFRDNTERKQAEEKLRFLSTHDILTGIYNRAYFEEELARLEKSRMFPISILLIDIDGLKRVNDRYGHPSGDELIKRASGVLASAFRSEDIVARIGGDEFCILLPSTDEKTAEAMVARVRHLLEVHNASRPKLPLGMSIGAATARRGEKMTRVLQRADRMMYQEKEGKGGNRAPYP